MNHPANNIIPPKAKGKNIDLAQEVTLDTRSAANDTFDTACKRMLTVRDWHQLAGPATAAFSLKDEQGNDCFREAKPGDYIQIDIPGPGLASGDGFDWVKVEAIEHRRNSKSEAESIGMRLRACSNPNTSGHETAHFFSDDATSTFIISRKDKTVAATYHGRNEVINTNTKTTKNTIRNVIVGSGAKAGISELQWTALIKSFLDK
jgi:hypothetical protein